VRGGEGRGWRRTNDETDFGFVGRLSVGKGDLDVDLGCAPGSEFFVDGFGADGKFAETTWGHGDGAGASSSSRPLERKEKWK